MNTPKDYTRMSSDMWKKTVEKYREDMLKLAGRSKIAVSEMAQNLPEPPSPEVSQPERRIEPMPQPMPQPMPEPLHSPSTFKITDSEPISEQPSDGDMKLREEQELQKLFERTRQAREELEELERKKEELEKMLSQQEQISLENDRQQSPINNSINQDGDGGMLPPRYGASGGTTRYGSETSDNGPLNFWTLDETRRLPNSIPIPERELPVDNSGIILPPPNSGPGEGDNDIIDFEVEPAEYEANIQQDAQQEEEGFDEPAIPAQTPEPQTPAVPSNEASEADGEPSPPTFTPGGDRIIRPDYGNTQVDSPVERRRTTPTNMEMIPRNEYDFSQLTGSANLIVQVFTARQALPVPNATVSVSRETDSGGNMETLAVYTTDENGKTPPISLPTPPAYLSETPGYSNPYAKYSVNVKKDGYFDNSVNGIRMFDQITTIEPVNMIPMPLGETGGVEQFDISGYDL